MIVNLSHARTCFFFASRCFSNLYFFLPCVSLITCSSYSNDYFFIKLSRDVSDCNKRIIIGSIRSCTKWIPPFPLHAPTLILLSLAEMQISFTLTLSLLMIWYSEQTALFLFLLARAAPAYLPTALSVALRPLFHFQQAQYVQVFVDVCYLSIFLYFFAIVFAI